MAFDLNVETLRLAHVWNLDGTYLCKLQVSVALWQSVMTLKTHRCQGGHWGVMGIYFGLYRGNMAPLPSTASIELDSVHFVSQGLTWQIGRNKNDDSPPPHNPARPSPLRPSCISALLVPSNAKGLVGQSCFGNQDSQITGSLVKLLVRMVVWDVGAGIWLMELYNRYGRWHANKQTRSKPTCLISWKSAGNENVIVWLGTRRNQSFIKSLEGNVQLNHKSQINVQIC